MKRGLAAVVALCLAGCSAGGAAPAEAPSGGAPPPAKNGLESSDEEQAPGAGGENRFAEPPASTKEEAKAEAMSLTAALALFEESESRLSSPVLDCGKACKALGSMERSMDRICELTGPDDPERRCQSAREKAKAARERVEKHCPECA